MIKALVMHKPNKVRNKKRKKNIFYNTWIRIDTGLFMNYTNVLLYMQYPGPEWRIFHILNRILMIPFLGFSRSFVYRIKTKLHSGLKIWIFHLVLKTTIFSSLRLFVKYCFYHSKVKFICSPAVYSNILPLENHHQGNIVVTDWWYTESGSPSQVDSNIARHAMD